jgi:ribosomal-protein-alanine N-acetyltransferase
VIRQATPDDLPLVRDLWTEFTHEVPDEPWRDPDLEEDLVWLEDAIRDHVVLLADDVGLAVALMKGKRHGFLDVLYVRPRARGAGLARELAHEAVSRLRERGADVVELEVLASNTAARAIYERWGLQPIELTLAAPADALQQRLAMEPSGPTFGVVYVQTDDRDAVERTVQRTLPRLGRSEETDVGEVANGWVAVRTDLTDREPEKLKALAKELSYTTGGVVLSLGVERGAVVRYNLYDRGANMDEYLSIPEYYGPLPPGDALALGSNPTVVARLTGADPQRVRETARVAASPAELPPALELYAQIADVLGLRA